jgi:hypothetical protein
LWEGLYAPTDWLLVLMIVIQISERITSKNMIGSSETVVRQGAWIYDLRLMIYDLAKHGMPHAEYAKAAERRFDVAGLGEPGDRAATKTEHKSLIPVLNL